MNEQLSEPARQTLEAFTAGLTPRPADQADAWGRLQATLAAERRDDGGWTFSRRLRRSARYVRGYVRRMWMPMVIVVALALTVGSLLSDSRGDAYIELADAALQRGDYRGAYELLVEHSRRYRTKSAAEARMGRVVDALCGLGMDEKAEDDLRRYLELNPESQHAARIDDPCAPVR